MVSKQSPALSRDERQAVSPALSTEVASTAAAPVLTQLVGHIYSPRIKLLDIDQVCEATGQGKTTIYELIKDGRFPKPQQNLGKNMWRESALIKWADANDPNLDA